MGYNNILSPRELKLPLGLERFSDKLPKVVLEIGFGNGEYTVKWAAANPDSLVVGLEVSFSCVVRCARRIKDAGLSNLKIIRTDARFMMKELFADESLDMVMMNFPCPWPKTRHAKRRVTAKEFADSLAAVLKTGGVFELVTDEEWYAAEVQKALSGHEALSVSCETDFSRAVTTKYERKWLAMGKKITKLSVTKTKKFTVDRRTWKFDWNNEEDTAMHVRPENPCLKTGSPFCPACRAPSGTRAGHSADITLPPMSTMIKNFWWKRSRPTTNSSSVSTSRSSSATRASW